MREKKDKLKTQGDFYKYFAKKYPEVINELGNKWIPRRWNESYDYFTINDYGWRNFLSVLPKELKSKVQNEVFDFITKEMNVEELLTSVQKTVNNYWNKIVVVKNIQEGEEGRFRDLMSGIKNLSILSKHGVIRTSKQRLGMDLDDINAEDFDIKEMPPRYEGINDKTLGRSAYFTEDVCWWEIRINSVLNDSGYFYFKANNPEKIPDMKCTIVDGVFMAIPGNLVDKALTARFTKLISDNDSGKRTLPKGKKRLTRYEIEDMDMDELDRVIKDYKLSDIDTDAYDEEDHDDYVEVIISKMGEYGYMKK